MASAWFELKKNSYGSIQDGDVVRARVRPVAVGLPSKSMKLNIPRLVRDGIEVVGSLVEGSTQGNARHSPAPGRVADDVGMFAE